MLEMMLITTLQLEYILVNIHIHACAVATEFTYGVFMWYRYSLALPNCFFLYFICEGSGDHDQ